MNGSRVHRGADCVDVGASCLTRLERSSVGITGSALRGYEGGDEGKEESDGGKRVQHYESVSGLVVTGDYNRVQKQPRLVMLWLQRMKSSNFPVEGL